MLYYWIKDHKYYKLNTHNNLFGTTDLVCAWGSTISNKGNYKVIHCNCKHEIDKHVKRITTIRKRRGYQLTIHMEGEDIAEDIQIGKRQGMQLGKVREKAEAMKLVAKTMIMKKKPMHEIVKFTGLTKEAINNLNNGRIK